MSEPVRYQYFYVVALPKERGRKTRRYHVRNASSGDVIGVIKWYGAWRQYCFFPSAVTVWSSGCLRDVHNFIANHAGKD